MRHHWEINISIAAHSTAVALTQPRRRIHKQCSPSYIVWIEEKIADVVMELQCIRLPQTLAPLSPHLGPSPLHSCAPDHGQTRWLLRPWQQRCDPQTPSQNYTPQQDVWHLEQQQQDYEINSLSPGIFESNFREVIFKPISTIDG